MRTTDTLVIGGGISGLTFAACSARAGRPALVVEAEARVGGCLQSPRTADGYWYELGAHTCYNSYVGMIEMLEGCGLAERLVTRAPTKLRFLVDGRMAPGANLLALLRRFSWIELAWHVPRLIGARKQGHSVREFYAGIVGAENYRRTLGPMMSAVPSQSADDFPADMLFKSRGSRRTDLPRSFTLDGGLEVAAQLLASETGVSVITGARAERIAAQPHGGFVATLADGTVIEAATVAVATGPSVAARLLGAVAPEAAGTLGRIREAVLDTIAVVLPLAAVSWPVTMFAVPIDDMLHSVVTRDSVPDPRYRAFTFHFKPGIAREDRVARMAAILGVRPDALGPIAERQVMLPSPAVGHEALCRELDAWLARRPLALIGNYFDGLSIEDCVQRARAQWTRVAQGA